MTIFYVEGTNCKWERMKWLLVGTLDAGTDSLAAPVRSAQRWQLTGPCVVADVFESDILAWE